MSLDGRKLSLDQLNTLREHAVRLRLSGSSLTEIEALTGLSAPTVIGAHKSFLTGGWAAVAVHRRGRNVGDGRVLSGRQEAELLNLVATNAPDWYGLPFSLWQLEAMQALSKHRFSVAMSPRTAARYLARWGYSATRPLSRLEAAGGSLVRWELDVYADIRRRAAAAGAEIHWVDEAGVAPPALDGGACGPRVNFVRAVTARGKLRWLTYQGGLRAPVLIDFFDRLLADTGRTLFVMLDGMQWQRAAAFASWLRERPEHILAFHLPEARGGVLPWREGSRRASSAPPLETESPKGALPSGSPLETQLRHLMAHLNGKAPAYALRRSIGEAQLMNLTHLQRLEAESIHVMREVVAEADNPVMLYSIGKDSAVMLHLARKAFYPAVPPFPLLHVDTQWKFRDMYAFRDRMAQESGMELLVHVNPEGVARNINPFTHGSAIHTDVMKTEGLKQALEKYGFDAAFGGARRDEEKSRAKERVFSFRSAQHRWDPKNQRPELWKLYNARKHKGESIRVFPLSNWTELDIWQYIYLENIPIVPLYYAAKRPVVERDGALIMVDDHRMPLKRGEVPMLRTVRFRTLGCYPLTGAVESEADTLPAIIQEMLLTRTSERQGRVIDHDSAASMEKKKQEGYF